VTPFCPEYNAAIKLRDELNEEHARWPASGFYQVNPSNYASFQTVFGAVFTVLIALEFKQTLLVTLHDRESVVQVRSVILIALLALMRKFITIDVKTVPPAMVRVAFLLVVYSVAATAFPGQASSPGSEREKDVYAIYSLMLDNPGTSHGPDNNERYLIASTTAARRLQDSCVVPPRERAADFREVLADYERWKDKPRELKPAFAIRKPYLLLSADHANGDIVMVRGPLWSPLVESVREAE
jgi:uncharacterized membrane protein (DUF373 family)